MLGFSARKVCRFFPSIGPQRGSACHRHRYAAKIRSRKRLNRQPCGNDGCGAGSGQVSSKSWTQLGHPCFPENSHPHLLHLATAHAFPIRVSFPVALAPGMANGRASQPFTYTRDLLRSRTVDPDVAFCRNRLPARCREKPCPTGNPSFVSTHSKRPVVMERVPRTPIARVVWIFRSGPVVQCEPIGSKAKRCRGLGRHPWLSRKQTEVSYEGPC